MSGHTQARYLPRWQLEGVRGAVVAVDVIRAFTTAAYAFAAGAREIFLVESVADALAFKQADRAVLAIGEEHGMRPAGFDLSNSPVQASRRDLRGRTLVQRTSAGTQGVLAARDAERLWCASLVCASATARAVSASGLGAPTYVVTGQTLDSERMGHDDLAVAEFIERIRLGIVDDGAATARYLLTCDEALRTLALAGEHADPDDIAFAARVDAFDFAMEATRTARGMRLIAA
jgi:2-phosphosulfolactate phosphatase